MNAEDTAHIACDQRPSALATHPTSHWTRMNADERGKTGLILPVISARLRSPRTRRCGRVSASHYLFSMQLTITESGGFVVMSQSAPRAAIL